MLSEDELGRLARTHLPVPKEGPWPATERPERRHYEPANKAHLPARMSLKVVGVSFVESYPANIDALEERLGSGPPPLRLLREPDNPRDANAVRVEAISVDGEAEHLGYVAGALAGRLAPEMDTGVDWDITAAEVLRTAIRPWVPIGMQRIRFSIRLTMWAHRAAVGAYSDRPGLSVTIERRA